jgi:MFS family permease
MPPIVLFLLTILIFGALGWLAGRRSDRNEARRIVLAAQPLLILLTIGLAVANARAGDDPHGMGLFLSLLLTSLIAGTCSLIVLQRFGWNVAFGLAALSGAVGLAWMLILGNWAAFALLAAAIALSILGVLVELRESRAMRDSSGTKPDDC